jgi:hypothetical protein
MNNLNTNEISKFSESLKNLPSKDIFGDIKTLDQFSRFCSARTANTTIARCFESKVTRENDPISHLKKGKPSERLLYSLIWAEVDMFDSLWGLIQVSFEDIVETLAKEKVTLPFSTAWDLFLDLVKLQEDLTFCQCFAGSYKSLNVSQSLKFNKILKKIVWGKISEKENETLSFILNEKCISECFAIVYFICVKSSKKNTTIANRLNAFKSTVVNITCIQEKALSDSQKGRLNGKIQSSEWIDGVEYRGKRAS